MTRRKKGLMVFGSIVLLIAIAIYFFQWNMLRGFVERQITEKTGRETHIGYLDVDLSFKPTIYFKDFKMANAAWGKEKFIFDIQALNFTVDLKKLFHKEVYLWNVDLTHPVIALEMNDKRERNWILKPSQTPSDTPPVIRRLSVNEGVLKFKDPVIKTDIEVKVTGTDSKTLDATRALHFELVGLIKGLKSTANGDGGSVLSLADEDYPYPMDIKAKIGGTEGGFKGTIAGLAALTKIDLNFSLKGDSLASLYPLTGVVLPATPPYALKGQLLKKNGIWTVNNFAGHVGESDLSGKLTVDATGNKPKLAGNVASKILDIDDMAGFIGARPQTKPGRVASAEQKKEAAIAQRSTRVLPDKAINLEKLNAMNADVSLKAHQIRRSKLPLDDLVFHLILVDGLLTVDPLNFGVAGGNIISSIKIDGREKLVQSNAKVNFNKLQLSKLFPDVKMTKSSEGTISGRAALDSKGNSFASILGGANGETAVVMTGGKISNLLLEIAGIDGGEIIKFLLGGDHNVELRCAVADFDIKQGVMKSKVLVIDTADTNITGTGTINLNKETLDLGFTPLPKDKSILSLRAPLKIKGTFKKPEFSPDKTILAARGGAAVLLGVFATPLAALIPLIETGPGKDSDCGALVTMATRDIKKLEK